MMDCPSCSNEVPHGAPRCKHCFSDLTQHWEGATSGGNPMIPVILLAGLLAAASYGVWAQIGSQGQLGMSVVDPREERVLLVYTSTLSDPTITQLPFSQLSGVELHSKATMQGGTWELFLLAGDERISIDKSAEHTLEPAAETLAHQVGIAEVTHTGGSNTGDAIKGAF